MDAVERNEDPFYSESNMRHLKRIIRDIEDGTAKFSEHELIEENENGILEEAEA